MRAPPQDELGAVLSSRNSGQRRSCRHGSGAGKRPARPVGTPSACHFRGEPHPTARPRGNHLVSSCAMAAMKRPLSAPSYDCSVRSHSTPVDQ